MFDPPLDYTRSTARETGTGGDPDLRPESQRHTARKSFQKVVL